MELEGRLSAFSLPEVLQFLALGKLTGILSVARNEMEVNLGIRQGKIISSSTMNRPNKLGEILVHREVIPRSALDKALSAQNEESEERLIGELLVEKGLVSVEQLIGAIKLQMEEEIWELFNWRDGNFKFEHAQPPDPRHAPIEIEIEPMLIEGTRRMDEWQQITKNIPGDETVFMVVAPSHREKSEIALRDREWVVFSLINGKFSIGSIISRCGFGTFDTYRILNTLLMAGLITQASAKDEKEMPPEIHQSREGAARRGAAAALWNAGNRFLSRKKTDSGGSSKEKNKEDGDILIFTTPIGLVANYINELTAILLENAEFYLNQSDEILLDSFWRPVVNICSKADLLRVKSNVVNANQFESFASMVGEGETIQGCYEDALEALGRLTSRLSQLAAQRLGEKTANKTFISSCEELEQRRELEMYQDFSLSHFVKKAIG